MGRGDGLFKAGVSLASIAEMSMLWGIIFVALQEYDPTHIETIGVVIAILSAAMASSVFIMLIFHMLKWKRQ